MKSDVWTHCSENVNVNRFVGPSSNSGGPQVDAVGPLRHKYVSPLASILILVLGLSIALQFLLPRPQSIVNLIAVSDLFYDGC